MSAELGDRSDVGGLLSICMQREAFGDLPNEDLEVVSEVLAGQSLGCKVPCHRRRQKQSESR